MSIDHGVKHDTTPLVWDSDIAGSNDINDPGRMKILTQLDQNGDAWTVSRPSGIPISIGTGDHHPRCGDTSNPPTVGANEIPAAAPTHVMWLFNDDFSNGDKPLLQPSINLGEQAVSDVIANNEYDGELSGVQAIVYTLFSLSNGGLPTHNRLQGDCALVRAVPCQFGGDTFQDVADLADTGGGSLPAHYHPYTVYSAIPDKESDQIVSLPYPIQMGGAVKAIDFWGQGTNNAWEQPGGTYTHMNDTHGNETQYRDVDANTYPDFEGVVGFDFFVDNLGGTRKYAIPVFLCDAGSGSAIFTPSFYQPHLVTQRASTESAYLVVKNSGKNSGVGFITADHAGTVEIASAGMPITLPSGTAKHEIWISDASRGYDGSWAVVSGDRPFHDAIQKHFPSVRDHYLVGKTQGEGGISLWNLGPSYSEKPLVAADWSNAGYHGNLAANTYYASYYSLGHTVGKHSDNDLLIENTCFQAPFASLQWMDKGARGCKAATFGQDLDLKGYRYNLAGDYSLPMSAVADSTRLDGGTTLCSILLMPMLTSQQKIWEVQTNNSGYEITSGRFTPLTAGGSGNVETYTGAYWYGSTNQYSMNLYFNWIGTRMTDTLPRYTIRVRG